MQPTKHFKGGRFATFVVSHHERGSPMIACLPRCCALACLVALAVLTLLPGDEIEPVRSRYYGLGLIEEHVLAYGLTAVFMLAGYARTWGTARIGIALGAYGGLLEAMQVLSPGRHPQVSDA